MLAPVGLRLVAVLLVRVAGDHVEGRGDAAHVLAAQELRERPEGVGAAPGVARQPVGAVAELAADAAGVEVPGGAQRAVAGGGEAAARPAPQVVEVVGERDREAAARSPERLRRSGAARGRARRGAAPGRRAGARRSGPRPARRCFSSGFAAKTLAEKGSRPYLSRSPVVRSSQQASRTNAEATRSKGTAKPAPGSAGQAATAAPSPLPRAAKAPAGSGRPRGDELHGAGVARDRRHAGDRLCARTPERRRSPAAGSRVTAARRPSGASSVSQHPRRRAARRRRARRRRRSSSCARLTALGPPCARRRRVRICLATVPALSRPGSGSSSACRPSMRVPRSERRYAARAALAPGDLAGAPAARPCWPRST